MLKQVHIYVKGDVTGVGFRAWTKIQAKIIGVTGWVRNNDEGEIEAVVQGDEKKVDEMIELVKQGPAIARVDEVQTYVEKPKEIFEWFGIKK